MPIPFSPSAPDMEAVRQIIFARLRAEPGWNQLDYTGVGYACYVEYKGSAPDGGDGRNALIFAVQDVFWQLLVEGVLAPGMNATNLNLPFFHVTGYGREVLKSGPGNPHDPTGYLQRLYDKVRHPDATVLAYLAESLNSFRHGDRVASTVMLGIAAERVFLLLCESLDAALAIPAEQKVFRKILSNFPMNPKLQWVHQWQQAGELQIGIGSTLTSGRRSPHSPTPVLGIQSSSLRI